MGKDKRRKIMDRIRTDAVDTDIADVCVRAFREMCGAKEPDGCLSTSAALYLAFQHLGLQTVIRMGQVEIEGHPFYHAWLEAERQVFDIAIYGNTAFNPWSRQLGIRPVMPQINRAYCETDIPYFPNKFDEDFKAAGIAPMYMVPLIDYCDHSPKENAIYEEALSYLNLPVTPEQIKEIRQMASGYRIGANYPCNKPVVSARQA